MSGHLQRDISIGNVLMVEKPVKRKVFKIPEEFLVHLSSLEDKSLVAKILELCKQVEELVAKLGISDQCIGFITDGDLAISWKDCFSKGNQENKLVGHFQAVFYAVLMQPIGCAWIHVSDAHNCNRSGGRLLTFSCG